MLRSIIFALSLLLAGVVFADAQDDAKQHMKAGVKLVNSKKFTEAILSFQRALDVLPEASGPHREIGKCYQQLGRYDEALEHYTEYLSRKPEAEERPEIEKNILLSRQKLKASGRAKLSIQTSPSGAAVYALTDKGERRGIGVSPIEAHPLELRFAYVIVVSPGRPPVEAKLSLNEETPSNLSIEIPETQPEPASVAATPTETPTEPTSAPSELTAAFVAEQIDMAKLKRIETVEEERKDRPVAAYALLGVSGAAAITGGVLAVGFFQTTNEMNEKIASIDDTNDAQVLAELAALDKKARQRALLIDISAGVAVLAGATSVALLFQARRFEKSSSLVQITPTPNGILVGGSF